MYGTGIPITQHSGDLQLREHAANIVLTMPAKQAKRMVTAVVSEETLMGADTGSFQLPLCWEDRLVLSHIT